MCHKFFFSMKHFTQKIMDGCLCFLVEELRFLNSRMRLIFFFSGFRALKCLPNGNLLVLVSWDWNRAPRDVRCSSHFLVIFWAEVFITI